jgi:hypothetical protein
MFRRLTLVGIFVLCDRGSLTQIVVGTAFCAAYLLLQVQAVRPRLLSNIHSATTDFVLSLQLAAAILVLE